MLGDILFSPSVFPYALPLLWIVIGAVSRWVSGGWKIECLFMGQSLALTAASLVFVGLFDIRKRLIAGVLEPNLASRAIGEMSLFLVVWVLIFLLMIGFNRAFATANNAPLLRFLIAGVGLNVIGFFLLVVAVQTAGQIQ